MCMIKAMTTSQYETAVQILQALVDDHPMNEDWFSDPIIADYVLDALHETPIMTQRLVRRMGPVVQSRLTNMDILSEERVMDIHLQTPFTVSELAQWMRGLDWDCNRYFYSIAQGRIPTIDLVMDQINAGYYMVDGVVIEPCDAPIDDPSKLVQMAMDRRISTQQFWHYMAKGFDASDGVERVCDALIIHHQALSNPKIGCRAVQFLCIGSTYLPDDHDISNRVSKLLKKAVKRLTPLEWLDGVNQLPHAIATPALRHAISDDASILPDIRDGMADFRLGHIRKIVRRNHIEVD